MNRTVTSHTVTITYAPQPMTPDYHHADCECGAQCGGGIAWVAEWLARHLASVAKP